METPTSTPAALPVTLVTGATGLLGRNVVRELLANRAEEVYVTIRPKAGQSAAERFAQMRRSFVGDERLRLLEVDGRGPLALPPSLRAIVHCAALVDFTTEEAILEANVLTTWHLLCSAAQIDDFKRFLHISSLTIRTDSDIAFSEAHLDTGQSFVSPYTLTKFLAEVMVRKLHRPLPVTIMRTGSILPDPSEPDGGSSDWFRSTVKLWAQGRLATVPMAPDQPIYPVQAGDLAATLVALLFQDDLPAVLHVPASPGLPASQIFEILADALGIPPPLLLAQHSPEWRRVREEMPAPVRRVIDGLYPPPPPDRPLAAVDSRATELWLDGRDLTSPNVPGTYWAAFAARFASAAGAKGPALGRKPNEVAI